MLCRFGLEYKTCLGLYDFACKITVNGLELHLDRSATCQDKHVIYVAQCQAICATKKKYVTIYVTIHSKLVTMLILCDFVNKEHHLNFRSPLFRKIRGQLKKKVDTDPEIWTFLRLF